jgi:hypothetical protein
LTRPIAEIPGMRNRGGEGVRRGPVRLDDLEFDLPGQRSGRSRSAPARVAAGRGDRRADLEVPFAYHDFGPKSPSFENGNIWLYSFWASGQLTWELVNGRYLAELP